MNRAGRPHSRDGFTLLEVAAAGVILAVTAAGLGLAVRGALRGQALSDDYRQAAGLLDRTLAKIEAVGPGSVMDQGLTEGTFDAPDDRFEWVAAIETRGRGHLYDVTVTIRWKAADGEGRSVKAQTLLHDPPNPARTPPAWEDL